MSSEATDAGAATRTLKLVVEYDGTGLCGWQRQNNGPTVQQHLEEALSAMIGEPTQVVGASRTDAGVHALGQVASVRTASTIPLDGFRLGLNSKLPTGIAIVNATEVADDFHARFSARGKRYRYRLLNRRPPSPLRARTSWHRPRPVDHEAMQLASRALLGEHDFSAFRAAGCSARTTTRRLTRIEITRPEPALIVIEVEGNAFLRNMVRILAGTLTEIGEGRRSPDSLRELLDAGDRTAAGQTAPPQGLTLVEVFYE